jgi:uncharacterized membrane protein
MFEFFFKYSPSAFSKGHLVFLAAWPVWILALLVIAAGAGLFYHVRRNHGLLTGTRPIVIWLLETALVALILLLLWHPALSVATLRPQQNVITVLVDHSRSMGITEQGPTRLSQALDLWRDKLAQPLGARFQVRVSQFGREVERVTDTAKIRPDSSATHINDALNQIAAEASSLPVGAIVLMSDGSDNSGGIDPETITHIRQQRIPIHTIGFGRESLTNDVEITDVTLPARAMANSRLNAQVSFHQVGYNGQKTRISVRDSGKVVASQEVTLKADNGTQTENVTFNAGAAGPRTVQVTIEPLGGEENTANNTLTRLVNVSARKMRIFYVEGEPRWEFKFIRRAVEDDQNIELVTMLRTTPNKVYFQGLATLDGQQTGFPTKAEDLFAYDGLIVGSVEANYFTPIQQELIRQFADRRGGGVLFLAGRFGLGDGGYAKSPLAEMMPVKLPAAENTFHRDYSTADLAPAGRDSLICRLEDTVAKNADRWKKMPQIANYQTVGEVKPGAVTLMTVTPAGRRPEPLLVIQHYGRGRAAVLATAGTWRWQMSQPKEDMTHEIFWRQLLRWLVQETPGQIAASIPRQVLSDETRVHLRVEARDKSYQPMGNARVQAHILGPEGLSEMISLTPQPLEEGVYTADFNAEKSGSYVAEITTDAGRDVVMFRREDGVAENFHTAQNKELLQKLSEQTGGHYYSGSDARHLPDDISFSDAGITASQMLDLWDMPIVLLLAVCLRGGEWLLRRKWGVV